MPRAVAKLAAAGRQIQIARPGIGMPAIQVFEHRLLQLRQRHRTARRLKVGNRIVAGHDPHALVHRRQKVAVEHLRAGIRQVLGQHDVRRQVGIKRTQRVADPGADARQWHGRRTGVHGQRGLKVFDDVGVHRANDAQIVGHPPQLREELAHFDPRRAVTDELERRGHQLGVWVAAQLVRGQFLALIAGQPRLGVERIDVREAAGEKDNQQPLGPRRMVRQLGSQRMTAPQFGRHDEAVAQGQRSGCRAEPAMNFRRSTPARLSVMALPRFPASARS